MANIGEAYETVNFGGTADTLLDGQTSPKTFTTTVEKKSALLEFAALSTVTFFNTLDGPNDGGVVVGILTPTDRAVVFSAPAKSYVST